MEELDPRKQLVEWRVKIQFLKDQIENLEKLKDFPIIAVAVFLLKCQIIEFDLKQIICSIELHLFAQTNSKLFKRIVRTPKDLEDSKFTLGNLVKEFEQFIRPTDPPISIKINNGNSNKDVLKELKRTLNRVVSKRNEFAHRLFSPGKDIQMLIKEAESGLDNANKALELLKELEKELKNNEK